MPRIAFYISSHGFGHATREIEVINHLPQHIEVEVITAVPQWLFDHSIHRPFIYTHLSHDIGMYQINSTTPDLTKTINAWKLLLHDYPALAKQEADRLKASGTSLVVGDISPMAIVASRAASLPNVIIANFSWDWIFQPLIKYDADFQYVIDEIAAYYRQCDLLLRTPLSGDLSVFPTIQDIALIGRTAKQTREESRNQFGIALQATVFLLTFGGNQYPLPENGFAQHSDCLFITFDETLCHISNVVQLDAKSIYHPDIVNMCDGVITKLGYGIVTECIAHGIPLAYPPRADFPEHEVMEAETAKYIPITKFDEAALQTGNWDFINELKEKIAKQAGKPNHSHLIQGGKQAADILHSIISKDHASA